MAELAVQLTAQDIADYFLSLVDEDCGDSISNLKLQKLVYYAQGFHLAIEDKPLFDEPIEAWKYGPVIPTLYHKYKGSESGPISKPDNIDLDKYSPKVKSLLNDVYEVYGQFSAWKLACLTHDEPPFKNTPMNSVINQQAMKDYFKTLLTK
ncbi:MAG: type II toxin-antitoxin system antitoxin SocA domain-containing protein [Sedimentisphaerales bacterium]|jgi:uncharacterized phage-associated protein